MSHLIPKQCRAITFLAIGVLLFNTLTPALMTKIKSSNNESLIGIVCTMHVMMQMAVDDGTSTLPSHADVNHCPYCKLFDLTSDLNNTQLTDSAPLDVDIRLYQTTQRIANHSIKRVHHLRAPPTPSLA